MVNIIIFIIIVIGVCVMGYTFYWLGKDAMDGDSKNKPSNEKNSVNDEQKFAEIFKSDDNDVIKRR